MVGRCGLMDSLLLPGGAVMDYRAVVWCTGMLCCGCVAVFWAVC